MEIISDEAFLEIIFRSQRQHFFPLSSNADVNILAKKLSAGDENAHRSSSRLRSRCTLFLYFALASCTSGGMIPSLSKLIIKI
jgi:hypothetical protein